MNSNCSVNNKSLYLTDINENSMESKFETIGSGISLIKETRNWRRKQTFEAGFEFYTKQSNFKISDVANNISNDFKYNFPQNKSWFESLIKASYSNAVIMNQHWGFGTTLSSYFLLTSGYNNIYYNQIN